MADSRFQKLANGDIYDTVDKKVIKKAKAKEPPKVEVTIKDEPTEEPKKPGRPPNPDKPKEDKINVAKAHTKIAREIMQLNQDSPIDKHDPKQLFDRGIWYFTRSEEEGITPTAQGLVNSWGFKAYESNLLLSGNSGLSADCREVISSFKAALEQVAEGTLVDATTGVVGKIFDLKNRFGWTDQGNVQIESNQALGELATKEELRKKLQIALAKSPRLDETDEPLIIDAAFTVSED